MGDALGLLAVVGSFALGVRLDLGDGQVSREHDARAKFVLILHVLRLLQS